MTHSRPLPASHQCRKHKPRLQFAVVGVFVATVTIVFATRVRSSSRRGRSPHHTGQLYFIHFQIQSDENAGRFEASGGDPRIIPGQRHEAEGGQKCDEMYVQKGVQKGVQNTHRDRKNPVNEANRAERIGQKRVKNGPQKRHQKSRAEIHPGSTSN